MCYIHTGFELCVSYEWRVIAQKLSLSHFAFSCVHFLAFHAIIVWPLHVQSHHTWTTEHMQYKLLGTSVRRSLFIIFSMNLHVVNQKAVQFNRECYCVYNLWVQCTHRHSQSSQCQYVCNLSEIGEQDSKESSVKLQNIFRLN